MHEYRDTFSLVETEDGKIHLEVEAMLRWMDALRETDGTPRNEFPFVLSAGERRSSNATTTYRDPSWRRTDREGALHINPEDAAALDVADGDRVICESERGQVVAVAKVDDALRSGHVSLPHGFGLAYALEGEERRKHGPLINLLTSAEHCDPIAKKPYHKHVPVRLYREETT